MIWIWFCDTSLSLWQKFVAKFHEKIEICLLRISVSIVKRLCVIVCDGGTVLPCVLIWHCAGVLFRWFTVLLARWWLLNSCWNLIARLRRASSKRSVPSTMLAEWGSEWVPGFVLYPTNKYALSRCLKQSALVVGSQIKCQRAVRVFCQHSAISDDCLWLRENLSQFCSSAAC